MAQQTSQNYSNHVRLHPVFHFFVIPVLAITVVLGFGAAAQHPTFYNIWRVVFLLAVLAAASLARIYPLKVQDRVIRLEERIRLAELVSAPIRPQLARLTERQLIALRFASDEEAPALVERTLAESLGPAEIKKAVRSWRTDNWRL